MNVVIQFFKIENKNQCRVLLCSVAGVVLVLLLNSLDSRIICIYLWQPFCDRRIL